MNKMTRKIVDINLNKASEAAAIGDKVMEAYYMGLAEKAEVNLYEICKACDGKDCSGADCAKLVASGVYEEKVLTVS